MFGHEIAINEHQSGILEKIINDISDESIFQNSVGHGHSPVWILGHLAIVGEMGQRMLGGSVAHPQWLRLFGPGSSDTIAPNADLTKLEMASTVSGTYRQLRSLAACANEEAMSRPHSVAIFEGSPIKTVGDCVAHLLTSHFSFHLSQLSSCRRAAGYSFIF